MAATGSMRIDRNRETRTVDFGMTTTQTTFFYDEYEFFLGRTAVGDENLPL